MAGIWDTLEIDVIIYLWNVFQTADREGIMLMRMRNLLLIEDTMEQLRWHIWTIKSIESKSILYPKKVIQNVTEF